MAGGSSKSLRLVYTKQVNKIHTESVQTKHAKSDEPDVTFSRKGSWGVKQPHDNPLVIMLKIENFNICRVLIDNGSSTGIMYQSTFQQIKIGKEKLCPFHSPLVSFSRDKVYRKELLC